MADRSETEAGILNNRGVELLQAGRLQDSIDHFRAALRLLPSYVRPLANLGLALREAGDVAAADLYLRRALELSPDYVPALVNLGDLLADQRAFEGAIAMLRKAVRLAPRLVEARVSLGVALARSRLIEESLTMLRSALAISPHHAEAHCALGHVLFGTGDWRAAWPHMEYRFHSKVRPVQIRQPAEIALWDGKVEPGLELWLVSEQGLGDTLQFARYLPKLKHLGVTPVLACDPRLVRLLRNANLGTFVPWGTVAANPRARWLPLLSIASILETTPVSVPTPSRYLQADAAQIRTWKERLAADSRLQVGVAWQGNPHAEIGYAAGRSPPLAAFGAIAELDVSLFSLQANAGSDQIDSVSFGARIAAPETREADDAFWDTAAMIANLDLVITSDTAIAHLAAALGKPTWICLSDEPDWRWMPQGDTTPWYSTARLFRQRQRDDWHELFSRVAAALAISCAENGRIDREVQVSALNR